MSVIPSRSRFVTLPRHPTETGSLVVAEGCAHVPFAIARMFTIRARAGAIRGSHAHRLCSQFMICVYGAVEVVCDDGQRRDNCLLDRDNLALLVPPGIWNTVEFRQDDSVLSVLCDRPYEEHDYVRDYAEFLKLSIAQP